MQSETAAYGPWFRSVALVTVMAFTLTSCATFGGVPEEQLSQDEKNLRTQANEFDSSDYDLTVIAGAVGVAILGAVVGALLGGKRGVAVGAGAGLLAGTAAGYYLANKKKDYAETEDKLDLLIADAELQNDDLTTLIATTEKVIVQNRQEITTLKQRYKSGQASVSELEIEIARIKENRSVVKSAIEDVEKREELIAENIEKYANENSVETVPALAGKLGEFSQNKEKLSALLVSMDELVESLELEDVTI